MSKRDVKNIKSQGLFNREIYEKALRAVREVSSGKSPYRAVGEVKAPRGSPVDHGADPLKGDDSP